MNNIVVITTFPNNCFELYAREMIGTFCAFWPQDVMLFVQLDDDALINTASSLMRPNDNIAVGQTPEHAAFIERNKGKDDPTNYRRQPVRFCHKVYALANAYNNIKDKCRYLIWMDADVHTKRRVTMDELKDSLPADGDAVSYMGRKDWPHSECGWMAFDLENGGGDLIERIVEAYNDDSVLSMKEQHDSWVFDRTLGYFKATNLTKDAKGMDVWPQSPMGKWSVHHKGPAAKSQLQQPQQPKHIPLGQRGGLVIQTKNAIPHEEIRAHIAKNQALIDNWIRPCKPHDEEIVFVSAGPQLIAEDVRKEAGKKIVAVKHALEPLKRAGVKPWASILLDPRPHVADFVKDADPEILWFVASQVNPAVTLQLLSRGCKIWGYHAAVGAGEDELIRKQEYSIISGGSATATRGMYVMEHLGFKNMALYGYDLCVPDKPDMNATDEHGQPKFFEMSVGMNDPLYNVKRMFWSEAQYIAQFEELNEIIKANKFNLTAYGDGIVPFIIKAKKTSDLRRSELKARITGEKPPYYMDLLNGSAPVTAASSS